MKRGGMEVKNFPQQCRQQQYLHLHPDDAHTHSAANPPSCSSVPSGRILRNAGARTPLRGDFNPTQPKRTSRFMTSRLKPELQKEKAAEIFTFQRLIFLDGVEGGDWQFSTLTI
ncbi:hypothetical protein [Desulfomicrobium baculatum]|uniref:hypothetical protein n=1 Tax=Desulfomicrobium baculatum TaxID=899 RepID=UPI00117C8CB6|nr:hypothetical protein [Desulfomicrobium baculatum]